MATRRPKLPDYLQPTINDARAGVSYMENRVLQHARLVCAAKNPVTLAHRLVTLREFNTRLKEARATLKASEDRRKKQLERLGRHRNSTTGQV